MAITKEPFTYAPKNVTFEKGEIILDLAFHGHYGEPVY